MRFGLAVMLVAALGISPFATELRAEDGTLIIVGGGLDPQNEAVFAAFLDARPAGSPAIAIISAASGEPDRSARLFREALVRHGADPAQIEVVSLAVEDDTSTPDIDESTWADNAHDPGEVDRIRRAGAIWFTGGDQSRITRLLLDAKGGETPMLTALRQRLGEGAVIGGTSAGAAIMSDPMIIQGDTLAALLPGEVGEPLRIGPGLGFLQGLVVDQHFGERARLGRLAAVLVEESNPLRIGSGIDEDTALVLRTNAKQARVLVSGYVTFMDARHARKWPGDRFAATGFVVSLVADGDTIDLGSGAVTPATFKSPTIGNEYFDAKPIPGGGMALGGTSLAEVAGEALLDNSATSSVEKLSFAGNSGVTYRFVQTADSRGWWGRGPDDEARYALEKIRFDIEALEIEFRKAKH